MTRKDLTTLLLFCGVICLFLPRAFSADAPQSKETKGIVALVDSFYLGGNCVYIDHGAGLITAYLHLSKWYVKQGQQVKKGKLIGRIGATGRVTGPHLHWGVKVDDMWVDGETLLKLDFTGEPAPAVTQRDKE